MTPSLAVVSEGLLSPKKKAELVDRIRTIIVPPTPRFDAYTEFLFSGRFIPPKQDFSEAFLKPGNIEHRDISTSVDIMLVSGAMPTLELFEMFEGRVLSLSEYRGALIEEQESCPETCLHNSLVMTVHGYPALASAMRDPIKKKWRVQHQLRPSAKSTPEKRDLSSRPRFLRFLVRAEAA